MSLNSLLEDYTPCSQNKTFWLASGIFPYFSHISSKFFCWSVSNLRTRLGLIPGHLLSWKHLEYLKYPLAFFVSNRSRWRCAQRLPDHLCDRCRGRRCHFCTGCYSYSVGIRPTSSINIPGWNPTCKLLPCSSADKTMLRIEAQVCSFFMGSLKSQRILDKCLCVS